MSIVIQYYHKLFKSQTANNEKMPRLFPSHDPTSPFWRSELHDLDEHQSLPFPKSADIIIIGGDYAVIAAAYHLFCDPETKSQPEPTSFFSRLEEHVPAQQEEMVSLTISLIIRSANNSTGGHIRPSVYTRLLKLIADYNTEDAIALADFEFIHVKALADLVKRENIDCDFKLTKSFDIHTDTFTAQKVKEDYLELKRLGIAKSTIDDLTWYDGPEAEKVCASTLPLKQLKLRYS